MTDQPRVLVGTSGFSYDDWRGAWYPPGLPKNRYLEYYAEHFNALEINASYYHVPPPQTAANIVRRSQGRLAFAIKAPGSITHRRELSAQVTAQFRAFLDPFAEAGNLVAVLFQFPAGFQRTDQAAKYLRSLAEAFAEYPSIVELRHASWDHEQDLSPIHHSIAARVVVDQPARDELSASLVQPPPSPVAYFRFHGRNHDDWYSRESNHARYRYRYGAERVRLLAEHVSHAQAQTTLAFFNNHPDGNAPHDAMLLAQMLGVARGAETQEDLFGPL